MAKDTKDFVETNRQLWDGLVEAHAASDFYDVAGFKAGGCSLGALERREVGSVEGKRLLHLLCRFGLDSLSWARQGATVTGIDISDQAITLARSLAQECGLAAQFHRGEVFETPDLVGAARYDVIYMSWGAVIWVSDFPRLARMAADLLAPGGCFYAIDGHPLCLALDETWTPDKGAPRLIYDYQTDGRPAGYTWAPDYAAPEHTPEAARAYEWAHGLGRIVTSLVESGLTIEFLREHDVAGWRALDGLEPRDDGCYALPDGHSQVPLTFSVMARKPEL
ncbi:MAG: class I SAM-dependent methyltransferase [Pseudomonadota bacterium]